MSETHALHFSAQLTNWTEGSKKRVTAIFRQSVQDVVSLAQSRIPVDTGFARASIRASKDAMPPLNTSGKPKPGETYAYDPSNITVVIASLNLGEAIYVGWTANYAIFLEYGSSQQAPTGFVGISALEWPMIVKANEEKLSNQRF